MRKVIKLIVLMVMVIIIIIGSIIMNLNKEEQDQIIPISSQKELEKIYSQETEEESIMSLLLKMPFSLLASASEAYNSSISDVKFPNISSTEFNEDNSIPINIVKSKETKEYSTTNIQVENVDEADITKTDGNYIYSLSENNVVITDVKKTEEMKIVARISENDSNTMPEDLILYQDKLVIIYEKIKSSLYYNSRYNNKNTTYIAVYNISNPEKPKQIKNYEIEQPYYTSRCIEGKLYVIASGRLKKEDEKIITYYQEDKKQVDPGFSNISRIRDLNTDCQTILSMLNLNNMDEKVKISSYLMDIENAYVSENNIYLLNEKYEGRTFQ